MSTCKFDNSILEVRNLSKSYRQQGAPFNLIKLFSSVKIAETENLVFKDVTFSVFRGETIGLVGLNGAGKSTLLKILAGIIPATGGEVSCNVKYASIIELGAGFDAEFTGLENLRIAGLLNGVPHSELEDFLVNASSFSELGKKLDDPIKTYSSGMVARLAFSILPFLECELLFVDEALAVGDFLFQQKCFEFFRHFKKDGGSMVLVSHDVGLIQEICDKGLLLWRDNSTGTPNFLYGDVQVITQQYIKISETAKSTKAIKKETRSSDVSEFIEQIVLLKCQASNFRLQNQSSSHSIHFNSAEVVNTHLQEEGSPIFVNIQFEAQSIQNDMSDVLFAFQVVNKNGTIVLNHDSEVATLMRKNVPKKYYFEFELPALMDGEYSISLFASKGERFDNFTCGSAKNFATLRVSENKNVQGIFSIKNLIFGRC